jgi:hypothetical protein
LVASWRVARVSLSSVLAMPRKGYEFSGSAFSDFSSRRSTTTAHACSSVGEDERVGTVKAINTRLSSPSLMGTPMGRRRTSSGERMLLSISRNVPTFPSASKPPKSEMKAGEKKEGSSAAFLAFIMSAMVKVGF